MKPLQYPGLPGRHLREVLRLSPGVCNEDAGLYHQDLVVVHDGGQQLAFDQDHPNVATALTAHAKRMRQRIYRAGPHVYCAVGYALANVVIVRCQGALVVLDTTESHDSAAQVWADFRKAVPEVADWPVAALVYTHNHSDHIQGARVFVDPQAVATGETLVIAHQSLMQAIGDNASVVAPILRARSAYSFGALLPAGPDGRVSAGIGPKLVEGRVSFVAPNKVFDQQLDITVAGVRFEFRHAPSETDDEIVAWLPDLKVLLSAEVVQGECLANVHSLRGTRYRDPQQWVRTLDAMRERHSAAPVEWMVPAHGRPVGGAGNVSELLTAYRDAIAFIHDQAVRLINLGATPEELADGLPALPPHLAQHPWLGEYYGTVKHSVRQVFAGLLGWFDGDPATLDPLPPAERAGRWVALAGGRASVLAQLDQAIDGSDLDGCRWAAELAGLLLKIDPLDAAARRCKSIALRRLGWATVNTNWRHWYLSAARELDGDFSRLDIGGNAFVAKDIRQAVDPVQLLQWWSVRLQAELCLDVHTALAFDLVDKNTTALLEIRRGVLQVSAHPEGYRTPLVHAGLRLRWGVCMDLLVMGWGHLHKLEEQGEAWVTSGDMAAVQAFGAFFEPPARHLPPLATR